MPLTFMDMRRPGSKDLLSENEHGSFGLLCNQGPSKEKNITFLFSNPANRIW
jgi:hypothetical protein